MIAKELDEAAQLRRIRTQIPVRDKKDVIGMSTMEQVWKYLNENYGKVDRIVAVIIQKLHEFKFSGKAKNDPDKFLELYTAWRTCYCDLERIDLVAQLDLAHALSYFVAKFPYGSKKSYISYCEKETNKLKKMSENMNDWLTKKRSYQLTMADLLKLEHSDDAPRS